MSGASGLSVTSPGSALIPLDPVAANGKDTYTHTLHSPPLSVARPLTCNMPAHPKPASGLALGSAEPFRTI